MGIFSNTNTMVVMTKTAALMKSMLDNFIESSRPDSTALVKLSVGKDFIPQDGYDTTAPINITISYMVSSKDNTRSIVYISKSVRDDSGFEVKYFKDMLNNEETMSFRVIAFDEKFELAPTIDIDNVVNEVMSPIASYMEDFVFESKSITTEDIIGFIKNTTSNN